MNVWKVSVILKIRGGIVSVCKRMYIYGSSLTSIHNKQTHYTDNVVVIVVVAVHCRKKRRNECEMLKAQYFLFVVFWNWSTGSQWWMFFCVKFFSVCMCVRLNVDSNLIILICFFYFIDVYSCIAYRIFVCLLAHLHSAHDAGKRATKYLI